MLVLDTGIDGGNTQLVLWIDTGHDYVPVRCEMRIQSRVAERVDTLWGMVNNTWAPNSPYRHFGQPKGLTPSHRIHLRPCCKRC
jgi:hypothetical protein